MRPYDGLAGRRPAVLASAAVNPTAQARSSSSHALKFLPDEVIGRASRRVAISSSSR
jgi:hypothetical protein